MSKTSVSASTASTASTASAASTASTASVGSAHHDSVVANAARLERAEYFHRGAREHPRPFRFIKDTETADHAMEDESFLKELWEIYMGHRPYPGRLTALIHLEAFRSDLPSRKYHVPGSGGAIRPGFDSYDRKYDGSKPPGQFGGRNKNIYSNILDPKNNKLYSIFSKKGKKLLKNFINLFRGGRFIGKGSYKCVFSPPIKCKGQRERYHEDGIPSSSFVSSIMTSEEARTEIDSEKKIKQIDPTGKFTLTIKKQCNIGHLEESEENLKQFVPCYDMLEDYEYPFSDHKSQKDLTLLIARNGGSDLKKIVDDGLSKFDKHKLIFGFSNVFYGLVKFKQHNCVHSDIKPKNLLFDKNTNKYYIIDYGFLTEDIYSDSCCDIYVENTIRGYHYKYWPFDVGICVYLKKYSHEPIEDFVKLNDPTDIILAIYGVKTEEGLKRLLINHTNKIKRLSESDKNNYYKHSKDKFDVFSLGITMNFFFSKIIENLHEENRFVKYKSVLEKIRPLIFKMTELDARKRISIEDAYEEYKQAVSPLEAAPSAAPSSAPSAAPPTPPSAAPSAAPPTPPSAPPSAPPTPPSAAPSTAPPTPPSASPLTIPLMSEAPPQQYPFF